MYLPLAQVVFMILSISKSILTNPDRNIWEPVCQGSDGKILLSGKDTSILKIKEDSKSITFVDYITKYKFKCISTSDTDSFPRIFFEGVDDRKQDHEDKMDNLEAETTRFLESKKLKSRN
jgi:hypothetical protein